MPTVETKRYNEEVRYCFDTSKAVLEKLGYKILRQRDILWLIQASKQVEGRDYVVNITWQALTPSQVTVSCLAAEDSQIEIQKNLVSEILTGLDQHLKPG